MPRPDAIRIDDLDAPRFSPEVEQLRSAMAAIAPQLVLEPDALLAAAAKQTGLDDYGEPSFRERLEVLCSAFSTEAELSAVGRVSVHAQLLQLLKNRLLLQDLLARHPEIHDVRIERPIIIAGLPRTGTTHLHNLMSSDRSLRSLPYWESVEPVLSARESAGAGDIDPRRARVEQGLAVLNAAMPHFKRMHEMTTDHVHEEIHLLAMDFSTMLFETMGVIPSWRDYYKAHDQTPSYGYLKTVLQALQWLRGGRRWVLKSPQHLEQFGPLMATFPDATVVVTHRDPVAITASLATMICYTARMSHEKVDPHRIGGYWASRVEDMLRACARDRGVLPGAQSIDVPFYEFMADDVGTVERIYGLAGQPMTAEVRAAMEAFMAEHPRGRHGRVVYDISDFGLDRAERRAALAFYVTRFGVHEEPEGAG
jgi:hypothetical protein